MNAKERKHFYKFYEQLRRAEYIADTANLKRKEDKEMQQLAGILRKMKGQLVDLTGLWQPCLYTYHDLDARKKVNPSHSKRTQKLHKTILKNNIAILIVCGI